MFYHDLDDLPSDVLPEHLVVISSKDFAEAKRSREKGKFLLEEDKHFLVMPTPEEALSHSIIRPLYENRSLKPNALLLLDKNKDDSSNDYYLPYDILTEKSLKTQMLHFIALCQHLGATRVELSMNENIKEYFATHASAEAQIKAATAKTGTTYESKNDTTNTADLITKFQGSEPNLSAAEKLMKTGIFDTNEYVVAFYNIAKNIDNRTVQQEAKITIDQTAFKQLDLFLKADIPMLKTIFNAEMKAQMQKCQSLAVEYQVFF